MKSGDSDSGVPKGLFAPTGDYWTLSYRGVTCTLRKSLGLGYAHRLLQYPRHEFLALDLEIGPGMPSGEAEHQNLAALREEGEDFAPRLPGDLGPSLDSRAKREFRRTIKELREEIEDLRERGDRERAEELEAKIEAIENALASATGIGGQDRLQGSAVEQARINVQRNIRSAVRRVSEHHSELGQLLSASIRTGTYCSYVPNPKFPIDWRFASSDALADVPAPPSLPEPASLPSSSQPGLPSAAGDQTMFVGRAAECEALRDCLRQAKHGESRIVTISGPPGIGKSRLSREISADARRLGFVTLGGNCYDREDAVPFIPIVEIFEAALSQAATPQSFLEGLGNEVAEIGRLMPQIRRLFPDIPVPLQLSPEHARRNLFNALVEVLARRSRIAPMLLLIDDVHWADEGTLALLSHLARATAKLRIVVILTYRDDAIDPAGALSRTLDDLMRLRAEQVVLRGLPETAVAEMIEALSGRKPPVALVNLVWGNSEGNPLFVEELLRHLERNSPPGAAPTALDHADMDLPQSLKLMIGRRLARVSKATQSILANAAVIGRSFTFALLEATTRMDPDQLVELVEEAEKAGLISSRLRYPDAQFRFAHELIRRAVLDDLSIARRQRLHLGVADALEMLHPDALEDHAEDLAHHLWNAGAAADRSKTIHYLQIAGSKAVQSAANVEAIGHFRRALQLVNSAPDSPERAQTELMLQMALAVPLTITKGYAAPEVEVVFARARHLCRQAGDAPQLFPVLWGMWLFHTARAEHINARDLGNQCLRMAEKVSDPALLLAAHHALGVSLSALAEFEPALEHLDETIKLYNPDQHAMLAFQFGQDFGVVARSHAAMDLWYLGYSDRALTMTEEALTLARKLSHPFSLAAALIFAARVHQMARDARATLERSEEALKISGEGEFGYWRPIGSIFHGWALAQCGRIKDGIAEIREGLEAYGASRSGVGRPFFLASLAEAYGLAGNPAEGLDALDDAYAAVRQSEERWFEPELHRLEGELTLRLAQQAQPSRTADAKKAKDCFLRAIKIANDQKAKLLELRAAISLNKLEGPQSNRNDAHKLLKKTYNWFTEGFDSSDLIEAKRLMESNLRG